MGRVAFVMSGGGAKGAFELGAVDYLIRDRKVDPAVITGVSTGNLNAAMLAQGRGHDGLLQQLTELKKIWFGIKDSDDIYSKRALGILGLLVKADSVYSNKPLWKLILKHLDPEKFKTSGRTLRVGVVGLKSGSYYTADGSYPHICRMVSASAAVPVAFNPVDIDIDEDDGRITGEERFCDGGVRHVTPLRDAFDALASLPADGTKLPDTIYVILASPLNPDVIGDDHDLDSGIEIGMRGIELLVNEVFRNDLQTATKVNAAVAFYEKVKNIPGVAGHEFPFKNHRQANIVLIEPEVKHLGSLEFEPHKIEVAFEAGRVRAKSACNAAAGGSNIKVGDFSKPVPTLSNGSR